MIEDKRPIYQVVRPFWTALVGRAAELNGHSSRDVGAATQTLPLDMIAAPFRDDVTTPRSHNVRGE